MLNVTEYWLCDIRIERIEHTSERAPWCYGGSGRLGEDHSRYYKADELFAMVNILDKVLMEKETTLVGELRPLIEQYETVRFSRRSINKQLKESLSL